MVMALRINLICIWNVDVKFGDYSSDMVVEEVEDKPMFCGFSHVRIPFLWLKMRVLK